MSIDISSNTDEYMDVNRFYGTAMKSPDVKYRIKFSDGFYMDSIYDPPNWFHRKMMNLLFGWEFEIYEE